MKNKKQAITAAVLGLGVLTISLTSCLGPLMPKPTMIYKDGVYTGVGNGMMGDLKVEVTIDGGSIAAITLKEHKETDGIYQKAETGVIENILTQQTTEVDAVSGATKTSEGIKQAVNKALQEAARK